jgi:pimeloyl-ACP methyl ester carboxylesterase
MLDAILPVSDRRLGLINDARVTSTLERYELERIATPTLVISARDDLYGTYETGRYTAEHIANARFIGYADGGHVLVGHQQATDDEVAAFLSR